MTDMTRTLLEMIAHALKQHPELAAPVAQLAAQAAAQATAPATQQLKEEFTDIYRSNSWQSAESVSGEGSELAYTANLRQQLPGLFARYGVKRVLDAPCGDFNWMKVLLDEVAVDYVGGDIVAQLVADNRLKYGRDGVAFAELDITRDSLPVADLMLCRDCLFHLSYENIERFLRNFVRSGIPLLLTTNHTNRTGFNNHDIPNGSFRLIDLFEAPFKLPREPLEAIEDWIPGFPERQMLLWRREQIVAARPDLL